MLIRTEQEIPAREISDRALVVDRRALLRGAAGALVAAAAGSVQLTRPRAARAAEWPAGGPGPRRLRDVAPASGAFRAEDEPTAKDDATTYNNFYELGFDKGDPVANASKLRVEPWSVVVEGEVAKPGRVGLEELLRPHALEERIYRLRCVEAWSMVIPWIGLPLAAVLARFEPTSRARFVAFESILDRANLPGQQRDVLDWPYREGLRLDEAMHPLALLAVGMYGETLPAQNGAPLRLVVPWKYGFKSIKSIVRIRLTAEQPGTTWSASAPDEYGFYANVNPEVDHPRWSQARERRIGEWLKRPTLPFNGYAEQVASLYAGMDLRRSY